jgi:hypothetical protein
MAKSALIKNCVFVSLLVWAQAGLALAVTVNFGFTGDNTVANWWIIDGAGPTLSGPQSMNGGAAGDWQTADSQNVALQDGHSYDVIFRVQNTGTGSSGNPAGFLAEISGTGPFADRVSGELLTSTSWDYSVITGTPSESSAADFLLRSWSPASAFGINNGSANIWTNTNGGPIAGIDSLARWIWSPTNFSALTPADVYLRGHFNIALVPLPPAVWLFGSSLVALLAVARRRTRTAA